MGVVVVVVFIVGVCTYTSHFQRDRGAVLAIIIIRSTEQTIKLHLALLKRDNNFMHVPTYIMHFVINAKLL